MTEHVTSADGTAIAFDRWGAGPPVVLLGGILQDRGTMAPLARALAGRLTVIHPDRRGRGESGDSWPVTTQREVEDVAALVEAAGGRTGVYGHSSGAALALRAAAAGVPLTSLVLHEPPYADDPESVAAARTRAAAMLEALDAGHPGDALRLFLADAGLPPDAVEAAATDPTMLARAASMAYDIAAMGETETGGAVPVALVGAVRVPTLVIAGGASPEFFRLRAERLVGLLPDAEALVLDGQDHGAPPDVVAPAVADFVAAHIGA